MSKVLNMVKNHGGAWNMGSPQSVPNAGGNRMALERKTAQAARQQGLLNVPFGKKGVNPGPQAFKGFPGKTIGPFTTAGYPAPKWVPIGLTPMALQQTLGKAAAAAALQMVRETIPNFKLPDWADPLEPIWLNLPGQDGGVNFDPDLLPYLQGGECGTVTGLETHFSVGYSGGPSNRVPPFCGVGQQVPAGEMGDSVRLGPGNDLYIGPLTSNPPAARMLYTKGWHIAMNAPSGTYYDTPTISPDTPPQQYAMDDPRARQLPYRMLAPLTAPGTWSPEPFPLAVPWKRVPALNRRQGAGYGPQLQRRRQVPRMPGIVVSPGGVRPGIPHVPVKPPPGEPEFKRRVPRKSLDYLKWLQEGVFHPLTELQDFVEALWEAYGCKKQIMEWTNNSGRKVKAAETKLNVADKMWIMAQNPGCIDIDKAIKNLLYNHVEDAVVGKGFSELQKAGKKLGIPGSYKFYQPTLR